MLRRLRIRFVQPNTRSLHRMECAGFFFFFQAEDGIRDYKVTGVQTCALPISSRGFKMEVLFGNPSKKSAKGCPVIAPSKLNWPQTPVPMDKALGRLCRICTPVDRKSVV